MSAGESVHNECTLFLAGGWRTRPAIDEWSDHYL